MQVAEQQLLDLRPKFKETRKKLLSARHLPGEVYSSPEIYDMEKQQIFMTYWLSVGRVEEIPNVGDYYTFQVMKESIEETGRAVVHELERFLTTLGTIASISPLMGLLGTIIGMIDIFASQGVSGANPAQLAQGISIALYTTGLGLIIAIPAMIFWRCSPMAWMYFCRSGLMAVASKASEAWSLLPMLASASSMALATFSGAGDSSALDTNCRLRVVR